MDIAGNASPDLWMTLLKSAGMLCVVLGVLVAALYGLRRLLDQRGATANQNIIKLLASMHVAPKERVVLLDVLGEKLLIGVTTQNVNFLAKIPGEGEICLPASSNAPNGFFKKLLRLKISKGAVG